MKKRHYIYYLLLLAFGMTGCYDRDIATADPIVAPLHNLRYQIDDDTLRVSWDAPSIQNFSIKVSSSAETKIIKDSPTSYKYGVVKVGKEYQFTFNILDADGNISTGENFSFTRSGITSLQDLSVYQKDNTQDVVLSWELPSDNTNKIEVRYDGKKIELPGNATTYTLQNMENKTYTIGVIRFNEAGQSSETVYSTIRVGSSKVAFIGIAPNLASFKTTADDDELAAANWFFANYPTTATYVSFNDIKNGADLSQYRLLWWIRDVVGEDLLPAIALDQTVLNAVKQYHANGGNLLLNTHAVSYLWKIGRMKPNYNMGIGNAAGGYNPDVWSMNVTIGKIHDESEHPVHKNVPYVIENGAKNIRLIGAGWKEDHNMVYIELPAFYGMSNNDENAYIKVSEDNNIRILATWSGISDYFMMANFETYPNSEFKGTSIAIGIGGFEWHQNDVVNPYQSNLEMVTRNAIAYLKTK